MGNFVWASGSGGGKVGGSCKKFSGVERRAEGLVRLFRACDSAELREVASGSAMQGLDHNFDYVGINISLNNSFSLSFLYVSGTTQPR